MAMTTRETYVGESLHKTYMYGRVDIASPGTLYFVTAMYFCKRSVNYIELLMRFQEHVNLYINVYLYIEPYWLIYFESRQVGHV